MSLVQHETPVSFAEDNAVDVGRHDKNNISAKEK
jgi:hypothetical protein